MKKTLAILSALVMAFAVAVTAMAEEKGFTFRNGVTFGMNMDQVMETETGWYEIDNEHTRGPVNFAELEYENIIALNFPADLTYCFVGNELVAIRVNFEERTTSFEQVKAELSAIYGEAGPVDLTTLANGVYAVDDKGHLEYRAEAIVSGKLMIVIEADDDDDVDVTFVDLNAAYINV